MSPLSLLHRIFRILRHRYRLLAHERCRSQRMAHRREVFRHLSPAK